MSTVLTDPTRRRQAAWQALPWGVLAVGLGALLMNFALHDTLFHRGAPAGGGQSQTQGQAGGAPEAPAPATSVKLTDGKFRAIGLEVEAARLDTLPTELGVPGRIEADLDHQVRIRPKAAGVIREVRVALGQVVKKGQALAVLDSADVGTARLDLRARQRELSTARVEADWKKSVAANVASLIPQLKKRAEAEVLDKAYADRPLGTFRATLLSAYADYDIAMHEEEKTSGLYQKQILGEHPTFVAKHTREGAQAKFESALEQARFDANLQSLTADQKVRQCEANVTDAAQRLRILGVPVDVQAELAGAGAGGPAGEDVTAYEVLAPFDGTIITKTATAVMSQKAEVNDELFVLADLSNVWVEADIAESDFALLPALQAGKIRLTAAAYPNRPFLAKVLSVGATVDPTTRTVPMLATTPNPDGLLKVGMFVRITLDTSVETRALTVPTAAVVEIEGQNGVFVPEGDDGRTFAFHPVKLGRATADRQVVASGLAAGARVVSKGAFQLKSELVLANEGDDE